MGMLVGGEKKKTNVLVCGTLFSGSSAVIDFLSETSNTGKIPGEFDDFRRVGLVGDILENRICQYYPSYIDRYLLYRGQYRYIPPMSPKTMSNFMILKQRALQILSKMSSLRKPIQYIKYEKRWRYLKELDRLCSSSTKRSQKIHFAKKWIDKINNLYCPAETYCVYDQPIFLSRHKEIWPKVFDPYKLIVVIRNPKDQLAELIKVAGIYSDHTTNINQGLWEVFGFSLSDAIRFQALALLGRLRALSQLKHAIPDNKIKIISFESLVNDYEYQSRELINFISDGGYHSSSQITHSFQRQHFDPIISSKNIGIYDHFQELFSDVDLSDVISLHDALMVE